MSDEDSVHRAAPAALGENVLRYAPGGPVQLTHSQREDLLRELAALRHRIADLKLALGDGAGWFDRAMAAERERDGLRAEHAALVELEAAVRALVGAPDGPRLMDAAHAQRAALVALDRLRAGGEK